MHKMLIVVPFTALCSPRARHPRTTADWLWHQHYC